MPLAAQYFRRCSRFLIWTVPLLTVMACTPPSVEQPTSVSSEPTATEIDAITSIQEGRVLAAARIYADLAEAAKDQKVRQDFELKGVEALFDAGYPELALDRLNTVSRPSLTPGLAQRRKIAETRAAIALGKPEQALELLPVDTSGLDLSLRVRAEEARAQAYTELGDIENALLTRVKLENLLDDSAAIDSNHTKIWAMLDQLPDIERAALEGFGRGSDYQGWIELSQVVHTSRQIQSDLNAEIPAWMRRFPNHPATASFAPALIDTTAEIAIMRPRVALLLPLEGKLAEVSAAVRNGFFAAYYSDRAATRPDVLIYDVSNATRTIIDHYTQAVNDGATAVIGPLDKSKIDQLAALQALPVPTIGLNYTSNTDLPPPSNLYQFGLLPEDEARAVAE
ncbi:MAG: penicillin-binding protein activator, partial [Pseudomonadota bacterium]